MLYKIIGVGIVGVVVNLILKQYKPEFCFLSNTCVLLIMLLFSVDCIKELVNEVALLQNLVGFKSEFFSPILKVVGVGYITEFSSSLAEETGNKSIADKIVLGGKITICVLCLPVVKNLINAIMLLV